MGRRIVPVEVDVGAVACAGTGVEAELREPWSEPRAGLAGARKHEGVGRRPGTIQLAVHAVIQGRLWLSLDDPRSPLELAPGDVALVRGAVNDPSSRRCP